MSSISNDIRDYLQPHIHEMTNQQRSLVEYASKCKYTDPSAPPAPFDLRVERSEDSLLLSWKADADIELRWNKIIESLDELGLKKPEEDLREFRSMARARNNESDFRKSLREHVASCKRKCEKEIVWRKAYFEEMAKRASGASTSKKRIRKPKPLYVETPSKLITWYQEKPERAAKRKADKTHQ